MPFKENCVIAFEQIQIYIEFDERVSHWSFTPAKQTTFHGLTGKKFD